MGDAAASNEPPKPKRVALRISAAAHVDVADLPEGQVSKHGSLSVSVKDAKRLLAAHPYLEAMEG